ncbi:unnamed protein product [Linum tenue]|uniref:Uncharacterized protein n=1 Tax=Linum tenue TaxID=586396 RepID=A0AAV0HML6_9ROSI|nr:unnamed protein product [Linum tenue]
MASPRREITVEEEGQVREASPRREIPDEETEFIPKLVFIPKLETEFDPELAVAALSAIKDAAAAAAIKGKVEVGFDLCSHISSVGFQMIDAFTESQELPMNSVQCKALFGEVHGVALLSACYVGDTPVLLAKPQTYMNLSGESVSGLLLDLLQLITNYFIAKLSWYMMTWTCLEECFDFNQSEAILATTGIGRPPGQMDPKTFLLKRFNATAEGRVSMPVRS